MYSVPLLTMGSVRNWTRVLKSSTDQFRLQVFDYAQ